MVAVCYILLCARFAEVHVAADNVPSLIKGSDIGGLSVVHYICVTAPHHACFPTVGHM